MTFLKSSQDGLLLSVYVQPRASKNRIVGIHNGALKIAVQSPPVDGEANKALEAFLSKLFEIPKRSVHLRSGASSRNKVFLLTNVTLDSAESHLKDHLP